MASPTFLTELKRFCQTTSVRGMPRIINSKSMLQSVIWSLGVLTCVGLLTWQMAVVFNRYLSYQVNTLLVQSPLSENAAFPDITICNLYPFVHEHEMNFSYNEYIDILSNNFFTNYTKYLPNATLAAAVTEFLIFVSSNSFFTNFPLLPHFGEHLQDSPILDCRYYNWNRTENVDYSCYANNFTNIQQLWDPTFYKCYTYSLNNSARTQVQAFSSVIYVEDYSGQIDAIISSQFEQESIAPSGLQVLIHFPGSKPDMTLGIPVGTGMSTKITIDQTKVTHLPHPYSNCTRQKTLGVLDEITPYSHKYCTDVCLQSYYLSECRCISSNLQFAENQFYQSNFTMCGNLSINNENSSTNWDSVIQHACFVPIQKKYQSTCDYKCLTPCEEYTYDVKASAAQWPHKSGLYTFYYQYIWGSTLFGTEFEALDAFFNNYTFSEVTEFLQKVDQEGVIKNKFLKLYIQFNSPTFLEQKDVVAFSFDAFGAQIGGVLSLWLGVTIILIFELLELTINLLMTSFLCKRKENKIIPSEETIDTHL